MITDQEIKEIKINWKEKGIVIDKNADFNVTFATTDILISDISFLVLSFFLSGKPIIFCNYEADYTKMYRTIMPGLYVVNNENELLDALSKLLDGNDNLAKVRNGIIQNHFLKHKNATNRIIATIKEDYLS